nr:hypothetical protein [Tanacetum cinerariifolium]
MMKKSSSSENEPCCSKDCKKNNDSLKSKITDLTNELFEANNYIYHYKLAVAQLEGRLVEYKERDQATRTLKLEKDGVDGKLAGLLKASKNLDNLIESQRSDKNKDKVGYSAVPPPVADLYLSPKKDLSWTGLPEFADDTVTDYSRPLPTIESSPDDTQNKNPSTETGASDSTILSKPAIKFVKAANKATERPTTDKVKTAKKHAASSLGEDCWDLRAFNSRNLIADAASSLGEDCWDLRAFNSRNLIADAASSLGEDVLMLELVIHTEKNDTTFHTEKTGMLRLVVKINVSGMTADVVDKDGQNSDRRRNHQVGIQSKRVDLGEEEAPYWTTLGKRESYKPRPRSDGVGAQTPYYSRKDFLDFHLPREWEIARDAELNPFKDTLVFRRMVEFLGAIPINHKSNMWESEDLIKNLINWDKPPKHGDGAWHAKIRPIDLDGEEFTKTLQLIPTTRKLSERESK